MAARTGPVCAAYQRSENGLGRQDVDSISVPGIMCSLLMRAANIPRSTREGAPVSRGFLAKQGGVAIESPSGLQG